MGEKRVWALKAGAVGWEGTSEVSAGKGWHSTRTSW